MPVSEATEKRIYEKLRAFDGFEFNGYDPVDSSIASVLQQGEVLADDGEQYEAIQTAVDQADSWVFVGPGTYYENVVIDTDGFTLQGAGYDTYIDGGAVDHAVTTYGENTRISHIRVATDASGPSGNDGISVESSANGSTVDSCYTEEARETLVNVLADDCVVTNCNASGCLDQCIRSVGTRCIVSNNNLDGQGNGPNGINLGEDSIAVNNVIIDCTDGINITGNDSLCGGNRIINSSSDGIYTAATDCIIFNNRISGGGINDSGGTGILVEGNLTGSAN